MSHNVYNIEYYDAKDILFHVQSRFTPTSTIKCKFEQLQKETTEVLKLMLIIN